MAKSSSKSPPLLGRLVKACVGVLLLPPVVGLAWGLWRQLDSITVGLHSALWWFLWGFGGYVSVHVLLLKPAFLFQLNHTLLERLAVWLFGGQVTTVGSEEPAPARKSRGRGKDEANGASAPPSTLVSFSPYLVPLYVVLATIALWSATRWLQRPWSWWDQAVSVAVGVALGFHIAMTGEDLQEHGDQFPLETRLVAVAICVAGSVLVTSLCMPLALPAFSLPGVFTDMGTSTHAIYARIFQTLF